MRKTLLLTLAAMLMAGGTALAVSPGKVLEFTGGPLGKVKFDGKIHKDAGATCKECHNDQMFPQMKQGSVKITMEEIYAGRQCGVCHNGKKAFAAAGNCNRCHVKQ